VITTTIQPRAGAEECTVRQLSLALVAVWEHATRLTELLVATHQEQRFTLPPLELARVQGQADQLRVLTALLRGHSEALDKALTVAGDGTSEERIFAELDPGASSYPG